MLERNQCERILSIMINHTVAEKLKAIEEAQVLFRQSFKPEMSDVDFAYSAMVVESQYNYIREILQVKQIRIKADLAGHISKEKEKAIRKTSPEKKANKYEFDMSKLAESFGKFVQGGGGSVQDIVDSNSDTSETGT